VSSQIASIVDYSAALAARKVQGIVNPLTGQTLGVAATFGAGQGTSPDPLRPGQTIAPAPEKPAVAYTHISDLPDAPGITTWTQDLLVELEWTIPMRLYVPRGNIQVLRATLLPFLDAYLSAFWSDHRLGDLCLRAYLSSLRIEADDDWGWLAMDLAVLEEVSW
jgi:hypothetical protein